MKDIYAIFSAATLFAFAAFMHQGYAFQSLMTAARHAGAQQGNHYHK